MESTYGHAVNLNSIAGIEGKWQFVPFVKQNGKPNPKLILIPAEPVSSKGGHFLPGVEGKRQSLLRPRLPPKLESALHDSSHLADPTSRNAIWRPFKSLG